MNRSNSKPMPAGVIVDEQGRQSPYYIDELGMAVRPAASIPGGVGFMPTPQNPLIRVNTGQIRKLKQGGIGLSPAQPLAMDTFAEIELTEPRSIYATVTVPDPKDVGISADNNPFVGWVNDQLPAGVLQSADILVFAQFGNQHSNHTKTFNMGPGDTVHFEVSGSFCKLSAKVIPRVFPRNGAAPNLFYIDSDPGIRNNFFSEMPRRTLPDPANGSTYYDGYPDIEIPILGYLSLEAASSAPGASFDRSARPTRRFRGSIPNAAIEANTPVRCPIPYGACAVQLLSDHTAGAIAGFAAGPLPLYLVETYDGMQFMHWNTFEVHQLPKNASQIIVYQNGNNIAREKPFELVFDMGF